MTNAEFREKFEQYMVGTVEEKIENVTKIINEASDGLIKKQILNKDDFYKQSKEYLEQNITALVFAMPDGSFIAINGRIDAYKYDGGWIDTGYLYNIARNSMFIPNVFHTDDGMEYFRHLKYLLDKSELDTIDVYICK